MTLYDFVDSIWLGKVEFRNKTAFVLSLCLTLFTVWGGKDIADNLITCFKLYYCFHKRYFFGGYIQVVQSYALYICEIGGSIFR